jgi:hypothetical protein
MKTNEIANPITTVLRAGTIQCTDAYCPLHPNIKHPTTRIGAAIIAPFNLASGGGNPLHFFASSGYPLERCQFTTEPNVVPRPTPMKTSADSPGVNPRTLMNTTGRAWNSAYSSP